jgi:trk system potassium uptake protein TrkA
MNILIVGAGKSGMYLAEKLVDKHEVTMVDIRPERAEWVREHSPRLTVVRGDGCEPNVLDKAGVGQADLLAALTGDDEDNLVVSFLAKRTFRVPMVFARTNHQKNEWMFTKMWGVDVAVSTATVIYNLIEKEVSLGDVIRLMGISTENMVIDDIKLAPDADAVGKALGELAMPPKTHVMAIVSSGEVVVPHGDYALKAADEVLILSETGAETELRRTFGVHP